MVVVCAQVAPAMRRNNPLNDRERRNRACIVSFTFLAYILYLSPKPGSYSRIKDIRGLRGRSQRRGISLHPKVNVELAKIGNNGTAACGWSRVRERPDASRKPIQADRFRRIPE